MSLLSPSLPNDVTKLVIPLDLEKGKAEELAQMWMTYLRKDCEEADSLARWWGLNKFFWGRLFSLSDGFLIITEALQADFDGGGHPSPPPPSGSIPCLTSTFTRSACCNINIYNHNAARYTKTRQYMKQLQHASQM